MFLDLIVILEAPEGKEPNAAQVNPVTCFRDARDQRTRELATPPTGQIAQTTPKNVCVPKTPKKQNEKRETPNSARNAESPKTRPVKIITTVEIRCHFIWTNL